MYIYVNSANLPTGCVINFDRGPVQSYNLGVKFRNSFGSIVGVHQTGVTVAVDSSARVFVKYEHVAGLVH